jgi:hypothetical protein
MKPIYVVLLMGAAAVGGGLVVRYSAHPTVIELPIPAQSAPVRSAPPETGAAASDVPDRLAVRPVASQAAEKPAKPDRSMPEPRLTVASSRVPTGLAQETASAAPPAPAQSGTSSQPRPLQPPLPEPNRATLRAGMSITVRIAQALSSNLNSPGDVFSGTLEKPVIADGFVIAERGAGVRGEVVESKSGGPGQGVPELAIRLREISASDGQRVHIVSAPWTKQGTPSAGNTGNVYDVALTRGGAAVIRPGTSMTFRLDETIELTEKQESR